MNYPATHSSTCACATCCKVAVQETLDAAGIPDPCEGPIDYEYALYLASLARLLGPTYVPLWTRDAFDRDILIWRASNQRQDQLDWQKAERTRVLEAARETGRQSNREGGYSASTDLCGPSDTETVERALAALEAAQPVCPDCGFIEGEGHHEECPWLTEPSIPSAHLPVGEAERKAIPIATGFIDYFPDAVAAVAALSKIGNDQHNPGQPLHWDRAKSTDEADTLMRHFLDRGTIDIDGVRHSTKMAWRALALLQKELEAAR